MAIYEPIETQNGRRSYRLRSPVDLEPIGELTCATREEVQAAVDRARAAQPAWAAKSFEERAAVMYRMTELLIEQQDRVIDTVIRETGKPRAEAMAMEVYAACDSLVFYAKRAKKFLRREKRRLHGVLAILKKAYVVYKPRGVVGVITPWNGPFVLSLNPAVQALMAGNAVVIKPSEVTPYSGALVADMFREAGLPENLVQVVMGDGVTGADLIAAGPDKVSFTGSVATGKKIAVACGERLIPHTLELGGKDAMVVCGDADIDAAAKGALVGSCMNTGQYCCGTERIYVVKDVYDDFVAKVVEGAKALRQSDDVDQADVGATFWDRQLTIIEDHVEDALRNGARAEVGGGRNPDLKGLYFQPTVLTEVTQDMKIMRDETFGPVVSIMKVADEDEAVRLANDSPYGLNGNVWTKDAARGIEIAVRMETGAASVNDMALSYGVNEVPFGGVKESGVGMVNGPEGLRGYCHAMPIIVHRFGSGPANSYPYTAKSVQDMAKGMKFFWGSSLMRRLFG
ncbi:MAG: aldehyde dehydrogenase family protein [Candidatus Binatia bacterium]|nr:aldehyde dehydrogenase family protein [Candidatus Binatia bacterium]